MAKRNGRNESCTCLFLCTYITSSVSFPHQMMDEGVQSVAKFTADCFMRKKMFGRKMMAKPVITSEKLACAARLIP